MSDCTLMRESMPMLLTESLDPARRETAHQHIEQCAACGEEWAGYRETWSLLETLPELEVPPRVKQQFMSYVNPRAAAPAANVLPFHRRPAVRWLAQAAAVVIVAGGSPARDRLGPLDVLAAGQRRPGDRPRAGQRPPQRYARRGAHQGGGNADEPAVRDVDRLARGADPGAEDRSEPRRASQGRRSAGEPAEEGRPGRRGHARHPAREGVAGRREHVRPRQGGGGAEQRSTVMRQPPFLAAAVLFLALPLSAANKIYVDGPITKTYPLDIAGTFWIDNPEGTIEIAGVDGARTTITAVTTIIAVDGDGRDEARENTKLSFDCNNPHQCYVKTIVPQVRSQRWSSSVKYTVKVPKTVHVRVLTTRAELVHVANIMGNVTVRAFAGPIVLDNVTGASIVESVNGSVVYNYVTKPVSHAQINAINASIEVHLPADSNFDWVADTLRGDLWTTLPLRGRWAGRVFRGSVNAPGGPTLTTGTMLGRVAVLANGESQTLARSVRTLVPEVGSESVAVVPQMMRVQILTVQGPTEIVRRLADINIGEAHG